MANQRIEMIVIKQIIQLKEKGLSNRKIAERLAVHRNSVNMYVTELKRLDRPLSELLTLTDKDLQSALDCSASVPDPRHKILKGLFSIYEKELKKVGCTYQTLWYGYKRSYPDGYGYTRFKYYLKSWQKKQQVSMPVTHKMGDKCFIDFTGKKLFYIDKSTGEQKEVDVFVAVLGGSGYTCRC